MTLDAFEQLARARRAVRDFKPDPLPEGLLDRLLSIARWAPSGYNLQPTHFITVTRPSLKSPLRKACLDQRQIEQAPATVIFLGDRRVASTNLRKMIEHEQSAGTMQERYKASLEKYVPLVFNTGPAGIGWLWKATLPSVRRLALPTPELPAVHRRYWLAKQVSLSAMVFMLAVAAAGAGGDSGGAGLGTCPMEGFDESRVKRLLKVPAHLVVVMVIPVGYSADENPQRSRMPLEHFVHRDQW